MNAERVISMPEGVLGEMRLDPSFHEITKALEEDYEILVDFRHVRGMTVDAMKRFLEFINNKPVECVNVSPFLADTMKSLLIGMRNANG